MHRSAILVPALASVIVLGVAGCSSSAPEPAEATEPAPTPASDPLNEARIRQQLFEELRTVTLGNCTLKRYGGSNDGGYLMCANLASGVQAAYSYGIATEDAWGCDVSKEFGVEVHQYDCFTEHRPACTGGTFVFHDECVGPKRETVEGRLFDTIRSQIARNGHAGKPVLMKIDVEGAEWDSLMETPDEVLDTFLQLPMELHGTNEARFLELVRRLKRRFHLVNLHFNNYVCDATVAPLPAWAFQVLWVHRSIGVMDTNAPSPAAMSPLNAPDLPDGADCQLP
jgi:hypothetical protein